MLGLEYIDDLEDGYTDDVVEGILLSWLTWDLYSFLRILI